MNVKKKKKNPGAIASERKPYKAGKGRGRDYPRTEKNNAPDFKRPVITGSIVGNPKGFGFLVLDEGGDDLFVSARCMNGAMHGDRVEAVKISSHRGAGEAEVLKVIERGFPVIIGEYRQYDGYGFVLPDNPRLFKDIFVPEGAGGGALNEDKVAVTIIESGKGKNPEGKVTEVLGNKDAPGMEILSIIRAHNLYERFSKQVLDEAEAVSRPVSAEARKNRKDFRDELIFTIDGDDSKDFDDAVGLKVKSNGNYRLGVHIADVTHYVAPGGKLDKEAFKRGTSVYLPDRVLPMLPEALSNGICSLNEGEERLTLSVTMELTPEGELVKSRIRRGVIRSAARMTYSKVAAILEGDEELRQSCIRLVPTLELMKTLALTLKKKRLSRGAVEFDLPESYIEVDKNGKPVNILKRQRLISHEIIEEFMLITNETVAKTLEGEGASFVYRAHTPPKAEKVESFVNFVKALGIETGIKASAPVPKDFASLLESLDGGIKPVVNMVALRTMTKASYEPINLGHFGLAAPYYCHFTSPIRRYPDLVIHRIIKDWLKEGKGVFKKYEEFAIEASKRSSEREKLAEETEREVDDLLKAEYMADKIGNEYEGIISGVTEWGVFVELDNTVEGLIRTEYLPGDGYVFDHDLMRLENVGNAFKIGQRLKIMVESVSGSKVSFRLAEKSE